MPSIFEIWLHRDAASHSFNVNLSSWIFSHSGRKYTQTQTHTHTFAFQFGVYFIRLFVCVRFFVHHFVRVEKHLFLFAHQNTVNARAHIRIVRLYTIVGDAMARQYGGKEEIIIKYKWYTNQCILRPAAVRKWVRCLFIFVRSALQLCPRHFFVFFFVGANLSNRHSRTFKVTHSGLILTIIANSFIHHLSSGGSVRGYRTVQLCEHHSKTHV